MPDSFDTVLITGASAGIGAAFARELAGCSRRILLVARRRQRLEELAGSLRASGCETEVLAADLTDRVGVTAVVERIRQSGPVDLLINNAGFGTNGPFLDQTIESQHAIVALHANATLELCRAALPGMRERRRGYIINLSSLVALLPFANVATYGASKAFLNNFSEALQQEVAALGVRVQCLCPGYTRTEFHYTDSFTGFDPAQVPEDMWMAAEDVVRESLSMLDREQVVVVPGKGNRDLLRSLMAERLTAMDHWDSG